MCDQYLGEIRMFTAWGGRYVICNWAVCSGGTVPIKAHPSLYALLGNVWGGNPGTTFGIPDMRNKAPIHQGQGSGLSARTIGSVCGSDKVTLTQGNLPAHNHPLQASNLGATTELPTGAVPATVGNQMLFYDDQIGSSRTVTLSPNAVGAVGSTHAHENCMPSMGISFIIALFGVYPERH